MYSGPTSHPTTDPTTSPTTFAPTKDPTKGPTVDPTTAPTYDPTSNPTKSPTNEVITGKWNDDYLYADKASVDASGTTDIYDIGWYEYLCIFTHSSRDPKRNLAKHFHLVINRLKFVIKVLTETRDIVADFCCLTETVLCALSEVDFFRNMICTETRNAVPASDRYIDDRLM